MMLPISANFSTLKTTDHFGTGAHFHLSRINKPCFIFLEKNFQNFNENPKLILVLKFLHALSGPMGTVFNGGAQNGKKLRDFCVI